MKIKKFDLLGIVLYPIIINPLSLIVHVFGIVWVLLTEWWEFKTVKDDDGNRYWEPKLKSPVYYINVVLRSFISSFLMLWFWNEDYAKSYAAWLMYKVAYWETNNGYHRPGNDPEDESSSIEGATKRQRILNLYWKIHMNHKTIWKEQKKKFKK